jgi:hypothetical protein
MKSSQSDCTRGTFCTWSIFLSKKLLYVDARAMIRVSSRGKFNARMFSLGRKLEWCSNRKNLMKGKMLSSFLSSNKRRNSQSEQLPWVVYDSLISSSPRLLCVIKFPFVESHKTSPRAARLFQFPTMSCSVEHSTALLFLLWASRCRQRTFNAEARQARGEKSFSAAGCVLRDMRFSRLSSSCTQKTHKKR